MTKNKLKKALERATNCIIQYTGYPCGTCFFAMSKKLTNKDWQALLLHRGDYKKATLNNLPKTIEKSLQKIFKIALQKGGD